MNKVQIEQFDTICCDNGKYYEIIKSWKDEYDYFLVDKQGKTVNEFDDSYINNCYQDDVTICVGVDENRNPVYAKIIEVYDIRGARKS